MTIETDGLPDLSSSAGRGHGGQEQDASGMREHALVQHESEINLREAAVAASEAHTDDMLEANQHLVMATLAAEQSEEATRDTKRRQDEFLAMLAHELRNPLAPIRSAVALLERLDAADPRLKTIADVVGRQVDHMARLLDDLLDASRVTSGKVTLQRRPTSVREFVDRAVEICRPLLDEQHQELTLDMPIGAIFVDGDPTRLAQIVGNLLHNASKYTPEGGAIALSARSTGNMVVLRMKDNGVGIAANSLASIFELFGQEDRSLSRSQGGLGIGLTVVRSMVERHGGTVSVRSEGVGTGSEFTVVLPRIDHVEEAVPVPDVRPTFVPARILLVDDNVDAGAMLLMLLEISGYQVEIALDGSSALQKYAVQKSQIVLCDIGLPGMDGYEIARAIREKEGGDRHPLLIALTGYDGVYDRAQALASGFDHHVAKPVDFNELLRLIQDADFCN